MLALQCISSFSKEDSELNEKKNAPIDLRKVLSDPAVDELAAKLEGDGGEVSPVEDFAASGGKAMPTGTPTDSP
jgi:hypothetical protein